MTLRAPESEESMIWRPFYGFRFPVEHPALADDQRRDVVAFLADLQRHLGNVSFSCRFDEAGALLCSKLHPDPDAASVGLAPAIVYERIRSALQALALSPPPFEPFAPQKDDVQPRVSVVCERARRTLFGRILPAIAAAARSSSAIRPAPPSGADIHAHTVRQFARLHDWCQQQLEDASALAAIRAWRSRRDADLG